MRYLTTDSRKYDQPFDMIIYKNSKVEGIHIQEVEKVYKNLKASIMQNWEINPTSGNRVQTQELSLVMPNPPFIIIPIITKCVINGEQYQIIHNSVNQLTRSEIKLILEYEKPYVPTKISDSTIFEFNFESVFNG